MSSDIQEMLASIEAAKKAAYQEGWDAAIASIKNSISAPTSQKTIKRAIRKGAPIGYRPDTTIAKVHKLIKEKPGLTGVEIYNHLKVEDQTIEERTVRTSLHRLRDKWGGLIENHDGHWYEKGTYAHKLI